MDNSTDERWDSISSGEWLYLLIKIGTLLSTMAIIQFVLNIYIQ